MDIKKILLYGVGIWALLVAVSVVLFSLEKPDPALFESIKLVALATMAVSFATLYLHKNNRQATKSGILVGCAWAAIVVLLDLMLYALGLFNLSLADYFKDVASSYIAIPITTTIIFSYLKAK